MSPSARAVLSTHSLAPFPVPTKKTRRVGLRVLLPGDFSSIRWFGRGPHENYSDRKASTLVARHASCVSEQLTPYIRPGECGGKADVRWLEVSRPWEAAGAEIGVEGGPGAPASAAAAREPAILFAVPAANAGAESSRHAADGSNKAQTTAPPTPPPLFAFSALPHLAEDLAAAMHPEELPPRPFTAVSLDHRMTGIGGDDSWSACVHDEFLVRPGRFRFAFALAPFWRRPADTVVADDRFRGDGGGDFDGDGDGDGDGEARENRRCGGGGGGGQAAELWRALR